MNDNLKALMKNPAFMMGAQMMAANQGTGMSIGPAMGKAALGTMSQLEKIEATSAKSSMDNRTMEINERRADIADQAQQSSEQHYKNVDTMANKPLVAQEGGGYTYGGKYYPKQLLSPMQLMAEQMNAGNAGMYGNTGANPSAAPQGFDAVADSFNQQGSGKGGGGGFMNPVKAQIPDLQLPQPEMPQPRRESLPEGFMDEYDPRALEGINPQQLQIMSLNPSLNPQQRFNIQQALGQLRTIK